MIVVMPTADNALGAGWYANSPALGNWEDFIVRDVIRDVDPRLSLERANGCMESYRAFA